MLDKYKMELLSEAYRLGRQLIYVNIVIELNFSIYVYKLMPLKLTNVIKMRYRWLFTQRLISLSYSVCNLNLERHTVCIFTNTANKIHRRSS